MGGVAVVGRQWLAVVGSDGSDRQWFGRLLMINTTFNAEEG